MYMFISVRVPVCVCVCVCMYASALRPSSQPHPPAVESSRAGIRHCDTLPGEVWPYGHR